MPALGRRSRAITKNELPKVRWEHSHVVVADEGTVRSYCVYLAPSEDALRAHASKLGHHTIDGLYEIVGDMAPTDFPPVEADSPLPEEEALKAPE
jgi:Protein of unknown function (DUF4242)